MKGEILFCFSLQKGTVISLIACKSYLLGHVEYVF